MRLVSDLRLFGSPRATRAPSKASPSSRTALASLALAALLTGHPVIAQDTADPTVLRGVSSVAVRASADWDELITTSAGGATQGQFEQALLSAFHDAMVGAASGPTVSDEAAELVLCHVDTFYDTGLIAYAVRVSYHRPDADGRHVIAWLESSVGTYTTQQLHVIWTLGDRCAEAFLTAWREANGR